MNIRQKRKEKGLTQEQLALKAGITASSVSHYENNQREPRIRALKQIAKALECSLYDLLGEEEQDE